MKASTSILIAATLALAGGAARAADPWWSPNWTHRRLVTVPAEEALTALPGDDVATATVATAGKCSPDGADIRVTTDRGQLVPSRVLMMGPGDYARVAFAARRDVKRYYVYFGCPTAKPADSLDIRRGVLMETWEYNGGPIGTFEQVKQAAESSARKFIGRGFVKRLFLGYNPFGPQSAVVSVFTAWIKCPREGAYAFSTTSQNASFLLVNDVLVVSNGGHHGPHRDVRAQGMATLKAGLYKLTLYHASRGGDPIVVAAWRPPGEKDIQVIPSWAFAPVAEGQPGALSLPNSAPCADFTVSHDGEAFLQDRYFHRYSFKAAATGLPAPPSACKWDFGDGQQADGPEVEHVYLRAGMYTVTLTARTPQGPLTRSNRVFAARRWDQVTTMTPDGLDRQAKIVAGYDFSKSDPETLLWAMQLFEREENAEALRRAGAALANKPSMPAFVAEQGIPMYANLLVGKTPQEAAGVLVKAAGGVDNPAVSAMLLTRAGEYFLRAGDDAEAQKQFALVLGGYSRTVGAEALRPARIGMGDVWRRRGDLEKAREAYRAAGVGKDFVGRSVALARGDLARHVEAYIRQKHYDWAQEYLEKWQDGYPEDRLEGYVTLLWVRLMLARKDAAGAAQAAQELVQVNPGSNYAGQLLLEGAAAWGQVGRPEKRKELLEKLVKEYPESTEAAEAAKLLAK